MGEYSREVWPGKPYPLGANYDGEGCNFAIFSKNATAVTLCLFRNNNDNEEFARIPVKQQTGYVWHVYLPGIKPGQLYGYRVDGNYAPEKGLLFNPNKLLIDPYAKAIYGSVRVSDSMMGYSRESKGKKAEIKPDTKDSAGDVNKSIVMDTSYNWENVEKPQIPLYKSIIYEMHVKGLTARHPEIPENERGTYKALASPVIIKYLQELGITAVELLPMQHFVHNKYLLDHGLTNYWGYNTIGFFAPHAEFSSAGQAGEQVNEFKDMVKALHKAGIEVILDVVYNHTGEGDQWGPTLCFRGIDNPSYYRLDKNNPFLYNDYTGTGNSINTQTPQTLQLIMDSLRYWAVEMQVDGFRFDLTSTLLRGAYEVYMKSPFLMAVHQDPVLSKVKLIAEPWDIGEGGYLVGKFPEKWAEWNGKYRDSVRKYWRGDETQVMEFATRISGSEDLYKTTGRKPWASINFVTAHDGFTLNDLVSYNQKHNAINAENNNDGENNNISWNGGVEGQTENHEITELRERRKRNFMATLLLSQGVPMICSGDEYGRTQLGNNNAYCQDSAISWFDWRWDERRNNLFNFTKLLIEIRKAHPILHKYQYFNKKTLYDVENTDVRWLNTDGMDLTSEEFKTNFIRCFGMLINGDLSNEVNEQGEILKDDKLLILFNSFWEPVSFKMPCEDVGLRWEVLVDTAERSIVTGSQPKIIEKKLKIQSRSMIVLRNL